MRSAWRRCLGWSACGVDRILQGTIQALLEPALRANEVTPENYPFARRRGSCG
jgi:hypothetical protein